jgi:putative ABC transport system ATP-binding protein
MTVTALNDFRPPVLQLTDVEKVYDSGRSGTKTPALRGVSMTVRCGEFLAIVGPSGSGKSTMLHLAGTLERPTSGTVRVDGEDISRLPDRRLAAIRAYRIGFVFQHFFLSAGNTALENVADGLIYSGVPVRKRRSLAAEALDRVGLSQRMRHRPYQLSGGEQQRVAIARALAGDPGLLLADEPTGNLDSESGAEVMGLLRALNAAGTAIALITHDVQLAQSIPRTVTIRDGRISGDTL